MYHHLLVSGLILLIAFTACYTAENASADGENNRPNIVLIVADDQGWGDLSFNGNTNLSTPNIDRLGEEGVSFDRFYVCPVCSPTRAEILTGRYHARGGVYETSEGGERLDLDEVTVAKYLKQAGYQTAAFGKWHNGMQYPYHPNGRGFDEFYGFCSGHWGNYFSPMLEHNGAIVKGDGFLVDDLTNRAMDFMETYVEDPFFVYLPYNTPHGPMQVPDEFWDKQESASLKLRHRDPALEDTIHTKAALAMCENIDWNVGRIHKKLEQLNLLENTIIIYMTDNGPNGWRWNGGMKGRKGHVDEGGIRSPLLMYWKDHFNPGTNVPNIASAIDLLPTLLEFGKVDFELEKPLDGMSLVPLINGAIPESWDRMIFSHWNKKVSVRSQQYLLDQHNNLFDMMDDPGQDKAVNEEQPEVLATMVASKNKWEAEVLSEIPEKDLRTFPVGHPDYTYTQIPARDGIGTGNIERSNIWPNCSFYTNWTSTEDSIYWDVEVLAAGDYVVDLYYTCPADDVGSQFEISFLSNSLNGVIDEAHDPPLTGMENDRSPRHNSYVKDFKVKEVGNITLEKGTGRLVLKANKIPGNQAMDFRLMMLRRV